MLKLLKTDLRRVLKDNLFLISCIIGGAFALIGPLMYKAVFAFMGTDAEMLEMMGAMPTAKSMLFQAFLPGGDLGLILPILITIVLCKDFSYGTIRNKIIAGNSRIKIFFSMLITSCIVVCGLMLAQALLTFGISLIFFEYSYTAFTASELGYLLISILLEMLIYITICSIVCFLCVFMKNAGASVVMYVGVNFLLTIIGSIFMVSFAFADPENKITYNVLKVLNNTNIFTSTIIGNGTKYTLEQICYILIPCVLFTTLLVLLGAFVFKKKDLK